MPLVACWVILGICIAVAGQQAVASGFPPPCDSEIYCTGELLRQVQQAKLFEDDKFFVDMPLKENPEVVLERFQRLVNETPGGNLTKEQLQAFVDENFSPRGQELENWEPPDWTDNPPLLQRIADKKLQSWARDLNAIWRQLGRQMKPDVKTSPDRHSLIYVPNPLIVPGGRFIEYYYWDSFWVIEGLLLSNMTATAKGMIENFLYLVDKFGHIPNGGRVYYERRSQPPFLSLMVECYWKHTNDTDFLRRSLPQLEAEYRFWQDHRAVNVSLGGKDYSLNRYNVQAGGPRPESYMKDVETAVGLDEGARETLWVELKSAAESGWDFSSRWFPPKSSLLQASLKDTQTSAIVPVDLNAILCRVEQLLALFCGVLGDSEKANLYQAAYEQRVSAVRAVLWSSSTGVWLDYNLLHQKHNAAFYPTNLMPLWMECGVDAATAETALRYLENSPALSYPNGLPTSLVRTQQQWDLPNAWAPLQDIVISGLAKSSLPRAQELSFTLAQRWIRMNLAVYEKYHYMYEKYDVEGDGKPGGGGEYQVQEGFGWTNGLALRLLHLYGNRLTSAGTWLFRSWLCIGACLVLSLV